MSKTRLRATLSGAVQGVGFRPFVYRIATELGLAGWVINDTRGVVIEAEGRRSSLQTLLERLALEAPRAAVIDETTVTWLAAAGARRFEIRTSDDRGDKHTQILPDIATCADCAREIGDPADRRHRYAFTNCTHCGPRLSIVESLPYDRPRTTMRAFEMCPACRAEYDDPTDRRFHAQPVACPDCGPSLALWDKGGSALAQDDAALLGAAEALGGGHIVAVKGLGGFHLMVDARNAAAIARLRNAKPRREKPLALMVHDLEEARRLCRVDAAAALALQSPESPIVLLPRAPGCEVASGVAPGNPCLGIMLPYTPLHGLLLRAVGFPVVATSGNLSDEPICTDEAEAVTRLAGVADLFLVHDRPIARHVDDSVVWVVEGKPALLRRARGYAPRPIRLNASPPCLLAVGAHLKNAVALSIGRQVFVSQHIGDMETPQAESAFQRVIEDFINLYEARPQAVACDLHPDYVTSRWARSRLAGNPGETADDRLGVLAGLPLVRVQHHHAHLAACLAENAVDGTALGVIWDGTGYGTDGTVWGGEFLLGDASGFRRVANLRSFALPGGEAAIREPRRAALGLLHACGGAEALRDVGLAPVAAFDATDRSVLTGMLERGFNAPRTTSAGRLFDAVAALVGLRQQTSFEGQAAMALEWIADTGVEDGYPLDLIQRPDEPALLDWRPLVEAVLSDLRRGVDTGRIAAGFHNAMVDGIVRVAETVGEARVALSGGCFQNRWLLERTSRRLRHAGFEVSTHRRLPPNDGGISTGQIAVAAALLGRGPLD